MKRAARQPSASPAITGTGASASPGDLVVIGKDILELLSSAMYTDPLTIYREYVQNSADAIEARRLDGPRGRGRVDIRIDHDARSVRITDDGTGIPVSEAPRRLLAIGGSRKRGTDARGFRGIGRLAGLAYCRQLLFRTRAAGDTEVVELSWDCMRLRAALRALGQNDDLPGVVDDIVTLTVQPADPSDPPHFFEVELRDIVRHHRRDALLNEELIADYLAEVAPVPFDRAFSFASAIEHHIKAHAPLPELEIRINDGEPLRRPHRDQFPAKANEDGHISECELLTFEDRDGGVAAVGWIVHHDYLGALPRRARIGGIRLRAGDIQVGDHQVLIDYFAEPRFNSWAVAEIHVLDRRIIPNARRDFFEHNVHFNDLTAQLEPLTRKIAKCCRSASVDRNRAKALQQTASALGQDIQLRDLNAINSDIRPKLEKCVNAMRAFARRHSKGDRVDEPVFAALSELEEALGKQP